MEKLHRYIELETADGDIIEVEAFWRDQMAKRNWLNRFENSMNGQYAHFPIKF